jgi:AAA+ superfamily predicted ATPase
MLQHGHICEALEQLSKLLLPAVCRAEEAYGFKIGEDPYRGLSVDVTDASSALNCRALELVAEEELQSWRKWIANCSLYDRLTQIDKDFRVEDFELLLLALAPEFDSGFEAVFGFLQDDVTRRRASVDLAVRLFEGSYGFAMVVLARLNRSSPLIANRFITLADPTDGRSGLRAKVIRLEEQFVRQIFCMNDLDHRIASFSVVIDPATPSSPFENALIERIAKVEPMRLYMYGPDSRVNQYTAEAIAEKLRMRLLVVDASRAIATEGSIAETARLLVCEANSSNYLLLFSGMDALHAPEKQSGWNQLASVISEAPEIPLVLLGTRPSIPPTSHPLSAMVLEVPRPDADKRFEHWNSGLSDKCIRLIAGEVQLLADRYTLTRTQIELAICEAIAQAKLRSAQKVTSFEVTFDDLSISARHQGGRDLESLTNRITPRVQLKDVIVPKDVQEQLHELSSRVQNRSWVLGKWGFGRQQSYGLGVNALFAGPTGTGKTMAAEAIAHSLGKDLYKIDLTSVVSKYIGETEQKLEQVFQASEATQAVLFFDEADSLLGKRSEVKDAHDRYANLEVSYLLQRMERYDGLIVLATNLLGNIDEAFLRRMATIVHFPKPSITERRVLWEKAWPRNADKQLTIPLASNSGFRIEYDFLAERFELTGGNIRNAVLAAAFFAAARCRNPVVTMWDVLQGVRREFQKLGQLMTDDELGLKLFKDPSDSSGHLDDPQMHSMKLIHSPQVEVYDAI